MDSAFKDSIDDFAYTLKHQMNKFEEPDSLDLSPCFFVCVSVMTNCLLS